MKAPNDTHETLRVLEWGTWLELATRLARTEPGRERLQALESPDRWARTVEEAQRRQTETQEAMNALEKESLWSALDGLTDPDPALQGLGRGAVLASSELYGMLRWLIAIDTWSEVPREQLGGELMKRSLALLPSLRDLIPPLQKIFTPEGEISEQATPRLSSLHNETKSIKREIQEVLSRLLKSYGEKNVLQDSFVDVRDGRYVLPVRIGAQGELDGVVHEASASKQTAYIEPREVALLNNRLRQKQNEILQEVYEILAAASARLAPRCNEIEVGIEVLTTWDSVHARARLAREVPARMIKVTEDRKISLRTAAHPLLWLSHPAKDIIRNTVEFGDPTRTLLITGPNTGGKTVLLKALGLAAIAARTGFFFPAQESGAQVPFFDQVFADLGDPQSIESQLSSFSGHILRFKRILESATPRSLVLIDELNSATDPEEGSALGRAILETLMDQGALLVATTHDPTLKALSQVDSRILAASMAFDERARTPTYQLVLGVPGRSRAIETAERLGLPAAILERARSYLSTGHREFEKVLTRLEENTREAGRAREEAEQLRHSVAALEKEWKEKIEKSLQEVVERSRQKLRRVLESAQDQARVTIQKLEESSSRKKAWDDRQEMQKSFRESAESIEAVLQEALPEHAARARERTDSAPLTPANPLVIGASVRIPRWKSTGTILEVKGQQVKVQMGNVQMTLGLAEVEFLGPPATRPASSRVMTSSSNYSPSTELDLRGQRFEEGMSEAARYLDLAFRSGEMLQVTIIHGLGTGALREGVRKLLGKLPYVKSFRDGGVGHGGSGATIVEFDRD